MYMLNVCNFHMSCPNKAKKHKAKKKKKERMEENSAQSKTAMKNSGGDLSFTHDNLYLL